MNNQRRSKKKISLNRLTKIVRIYVQLRDKRLLKSLTVRILEKKIKKLNLKLWTISKINKRLWIVFIFLLIISYFF